MQGLAFKADVLLGGAVGVVHFEDKGLLAIYILMQVHPETEYPLLHPLAPLDLHHVVGHIP